MIAFKIRRTIKQSSGCHAKGSSCLRGVKLLYLSWIHRCRKPGGEKRAKPSRLWHICPLLLAQTSCAVRLQSINRPPAFYYPKSMSCYKSRSIKSTSWEDSKHDDKCFIHMVRRLNHSDVGLQAHTGSKTVWGLNVSRFKIE